HHRQRVIALRNAAIGRAYLRRRRDSGTHERGPEIISIRQHLSPLDGVLERWILSEVYQPRREIHIPTLIALRVSSHGRLPSGTALARGRTPHHELRGEHRLTRKARRVFDLFEHGAQRRAADLAARLADRGER